MPSLGAYLSLRSLPQLYADAVAGDSPNWGMHGDSAGIVAIYMRNGTGHILGNRKIPWCCQVTVDYWKLHLQNVQQQPNTYLASAVKQGSIYGSQRAKPDAQKTE